MCLSMCFGKSIVRCKLVPELNYVSAKVKHDTALWFTSEILFITHINFVSPLIAMEFFFYTEFASVGADGIIDFLWLRLCGVFQRKKLET